MPLIIHTSGLRLERLAEPVRKQAPMVRWPVRRNGKIEMIPIPSERVPSGWQSVHTRIPVRLATCQETDCPMFLRGWTEIVVPGRPLIAGQMSSDEAAAKFGVYGDTAPVTIQHPPGTPCPRIHKIASGAPPVYRVNGSLMEETAFLDAIGEGVHSQQRRMQEGSY